MTTQQKKLGLVLIGLAALPLAVLAATKTPTSLSYSAWIPYWDKTAASAEVIQNLDKVKDISPFAYYVNTDGSLADKMKVSSDPWPALFTAAHAKGVKVIPTILWADGDAIQKTLSNTTKRNAQIKAIMNVMATSSFDGIDIDYENKDAATKVYFSRFITDLSKQLHAQKKTLVCTIEPRTPVTSLTKNVPATMAYANDYAVLNTYCDQVRIMAYDQTTIDISMNKIKGQTGAYTPVADPGWVLKVVALATQSISPKKIMLGVANYGYEYQVDKNYNVTKLRSVDYQTAMDLAKQVGAKVERNSAGELSFYYQKNGTMRLVWFSDASAINDKIKIAKLYDLKGIALFRVDGDSDPLMWTQFK